MSRGAVLHHYKTKMDLIVAAYEYLLDQQLTEIRGVADKMSAAGAPLDELLVDLWDRYSGPLMMITLDYLSMARTNDQLRARITPLALKFNMGLNDIWQEKFAKTSIVGAKASTYLNLTLCLARGMGVHGVWRNEERYFDAMVAEWRDVLHANLDS